MIKKGLFFLAALTMCLSAAYKNGIPIGQPGDKNEETVRFEMASAPEPTVWGSGNDKGFYELLFNEDNSMNLMYTDYQTAKQGYLCSVPHCGHNSDGCAAWLPAYPGQVFPVAMKDTLALVYCSFDTWSEKRVPSKIDMMNLDGTDARTLTTFADNVSVSAGAASNSQFIALQISRGTPGENQAVNSIVLVDKNNGNLKELYRTQAKEGELWKSLFLRGTCEDGFLIKTITANEYDLDGNPEQVMINQNEATIHDVLLLPYDGGDPETLLSFKQGEVFEEPYGDQLIYLQNNNGAYSLNRLDTATSETSVIVSDFTEVTAENTIQSRPFGDTFICGFADRFVLLNHLTPDPLLENGNAELLYTQYAVDLITGEAREITLSNYYNTSEVPLRILDTFGSHLFVHAIITDTEETTVCLPGIISVEDYIRSNPNYTMVRLERTISAPAPK